MLLADDTTGTRRPPTSYLYGDDDAGIVSVVMWICCRRGHRIDDGGRPLCPLGVGVVDLLRLPAQLQNLALDPSTFSATESTWAMTAIAGHLEAWDGEGQPPQDLRGAPSVDGG